jgi:hypothetical protein
MHVIDLQVGRATGKGTFGHILWHFSCYCIKTDFTTIHYFFITIKWFCYTFWQLNGIFTAKCIIINVICSTLWCHFKDWRQLSEDAFSRDVPQVWELYVIMTFHQVTSKLIGSDPWMTMISWGHSDQCSINTDWQGWPINLPRWDTWLDYSLVINWTRFLNFPMTLTCVLKINSDHLLIMTNQPTKFETRSYGLLII